MANWTFKIHAYLHDPPDKPLALGRGRGHAAWGRELAELLTGSVPDPSWVSAITRADHLASGADRTGLLTAEPVNFAELRHPLSGQPIDISQFGVLGPEARDHAPNALREEIEFLRDHASDPEARFYGLWGVLPHRLRLREGPHELGALWDWLPADTRMPNHPVTLHQSLVSALASVLIDGDEPALLSFTVGPVQAFIRQARRTSDLAGGSAMLAESVSAALWPILDALGPDHVVFPSLRRNAGFWHQVGSRFAGRLDLSETSLVDAGTAATASLPNRFLAIVPATRAETLARAAESALRGWWQAAVGRAATHLEQTAPELRGFADMALGQVDAFLQVAWAASPWPSSESVRAGDAHCQAAAWFHGGTLPKPNADFIERAQRHREEAGNLKPFRPNGGLLYAASYESVEGMVDAVKRSRAVPTRNEDGLKCSLCGERGVVPDPAHIAFHEQRNVWARARTQLRTGLLRRGEALCGVCWTKRFYALKERKVRVPSTAEIAATPFKQALLEHGDALESQIAGLVEAVGAVPAWQQDAYVVPSLVPYLNGPFGRLLRVPGEVLLPALRDDREAPDELEDLNAEQVALLSERAGSLRKAARAQPGRLPLPRPYLAALVLDGDEMGKWLTGAKALNLGAYLSSAAAESIERAGGQEDLNGVWPVTPALHATLSEACDIFSQHSAPRTLHRDGLPGFLVYSGGDDVLALTPIGCPNEDDPIELATEAAFRLRFRFSGAVSRSGRGDRVEPASHAGFVVNGRQGLNLAFGEPATASAALVVFHQKWPLGRALDEARAAEKYAKLALGRDALALVVLRRSGQVTKTGLKFRENNGTSPVRAFQRLAHAFAFDALSPRYLSEISRRLAPLEGGLPTGKLVELAWPLVTQALDDHFHGTRELRKTLEDSLRVLEQATVVARLEPECVPADREHLDRWVALIEAAAFLGRGGEV